MEKAGGTARAITYKITPAGSLSSSQPGGPPCWASPLAFLPHWYIPAALLFLYRLPCWIVSFALAGAAQLCAEGISSCCHIEKLQKAQVDIEGGEDVSPHPLAIRLSEASSDSNFLMTTFTTVSSSLSFSMVCEDKKEEARGARRHSVRQAQSCLERGRGGGGGWAESCQKIQLFFAQNLAAVHQVYPPTHTPSPVQYKHVVSIFYEQYCYVHPVF
jgi:hypothetical protein